MNTTVTVLHVLNLIKAPLKVNERLPWNQSFIPCTSQSMECKMILALGIFFFFGLFVFLRSCVCFAYCFGNNILSRGLTEALPSFETR